jgi:hypothetical protein
LKVVDEFLDRRVLVEIGQNELSVNESVNICGLGVLHAANVQFWDSGVHFFTSEFRSRASAPLAVE